MDRDDVLRILREHQAELHELGLVHLLLFGSVARGEQTAESDVDLIADFDPAKKVTLLTVAKAQHELEDMLAARVDLCSGRFRHELIEQSASRDAVLVF